MDITLDKKSNTDAAITIHIAEEDYQPGVEQKIKEYRKQANMKGFRPGKVPVGLIKKMYGKNIKIEEINHILAHQLPQYVREHDLNIVGEPMPNQEANEGIDWENQSDYDFVFDVGMVDEISYDLSQDVTITKHNIELTEQELDETTENLRKRFSKTEPAEQSEAEDILRGKVWRAEEGDQAAIENETSLDLSTLDEERVAPFLGKKVGDEVTFDLRTLYPEDSEAALLLGKDYDEVADIQGEFHFTINEVMRHIPAEVNQDFFDEVFGKDTVQNEEEFREKLRETISENYARETEAMLKRDIRNYYLENTQIDLPEEFLKRWLLVTNEGKFTPEQIEEEYPIYSQELKWNLLVNKIMEDREIKIEHEEVKAKAHEMVLAQFGMVGSNLALDERFDPIVENFLKGEDGNNYLRAFEQAKQDRLFEEIMNNVTIEEKEVTVDEFSELAKNPS